MYNKDDLDVNKVRHVKSDSVAYEFDSVIICEAPTDMTLRLHSAHGSRNTYLIKNMGSMSILSITPDCVDTIDSFAFSFDLFSYESLLIMDDSVGNWTILDFHLFWDFRKFFEL